MDDKKTADSSTYYIDQLTDKNYRSWAQQMHWILHEKELLELVEGKEKKPTKSAMNATPMATGSTGSTAPILKPRIMKRNSQHRPRR